MLKLNVCEKCGSKNDLHLHHIRYDNLPHNNLKEYIKYIWVLCLKCHNLIHTMDLSENIDKLKERYKKKGYQRER